MFTRLGMVSRRVGNITRNSLALIGLGTSLYALHEIHEYNQTMGESEHEYEHEYEYEYDSYFENNNEDKEKKKEKKKRKKRVLVIPFDKLKVVERKNPPTISSFLLGPNDSSTGKDKVQQVELQTLVNTIHEAAKDPNIVALYGTFGNGFRFSCGGYAHLEEIRNAIRVFNESHIRHYEPVWKRVHASDGDDDEDEGDATYDVISSSVSSGTSVMSSSDHKTKMDALHPTNDNQENTNKHQHHHHHHHHHQQHQQKSPMQKYSYAYADTFDHPINSASNKEYYLASAFSNILLQPRGNVQLSGVSTSNIFLKNALDKYGIKVHVFKHGKYKNAPNSFTERSYTKSHLENTKSIIQSINNTIQTSITNSRNLHDQFSNTTIWQSLHDYGTLSAKNAQEVHLVDYLPKIDPLHELISLNKHDDHRINASSSSAAAAANTGIGMDKKKKRSHNAVVDKRRMDYLRKSWTWLLNEQKEQRFIADEAISLHDYIKALRKREKWMKRKHGWNKIIQELVEKSSAAEALVGSLGWKAPYYNVKKRKDKIAIVHISGGIDDAIARNVVHSLQQIKTDKHTKAVILRVDSPGGSVTASETILEQCKDVQKPIICSFANLAASGGYYISSHADRIFASPTTITGSIGVFGIKLDATDFARSYGVEANFISSGQHAATYNTLHPLTKKMKNNIQRNIDKFYAYFKTIVSQGRDIPIAEVEQIAQGRVWTGTQAKENRLVDELGGLDRALSYAKRKYTTNGYADIEVYPKPLTWKDKLMKFSQMEIHNLVMDDCGNVYDGNEFCFENSVDDPLMAISSYNEMIQLIMKGDVKVFDVLTGLTHSGRVLLTVDTNTAVQQMLKEVMNKRN